jgi:tetratricopeptide (TPR) repeat protein
MKRKAKFKGLAGNPLKITGAAGLLLALALGWALVYYSVTRNTQIFPKEEKTSAGFAEELEKYDAVLAVETPENLVKRLKRLEKKAKGQEELLSALKRRRALTLERPEFLSRPGSNAALEYKNAVLKLTKKFPYSEALSAAAAESFFLSGSSPRDEEIPLLYSFADSITNARYDPLVLGLYALSGGLENAEKAVKIGGAAELLSLWRSPEFSLIPPRLRSFLKNDEAVIRILRGDIPAAQTRINALIEEDSGNRELLRLGADFFYDYGNPMRAAALYSRLGGDDNLSRQADALALAGEIPAARNIWTALAVPRQEDLHKSGVLSPEETGIILRSLYNLASSSGNPVESAIFLERLFASRPPEDQNHSGGIFGLIRYSRLLDTRRSIAVLEDGKPEGNPLLDLELLRRRMETWQPLKSTAEVWLLLGRHPDNENLFRWGACYFDRQKLYSESAQILKIASQKGWTSPWVCFHKGLALIREGKLNQGEKLLADLLDNGKTAADGMGWIIAANLGRILESRRAISAAIERYSEAAALVRSPRAAALIQLRLSRCYEAQKRYAESRLALEKALELDPGNLNVRHEKNRMDSLLY